MFKGVLFYISLIFVTSLFAKNDLIRIALKNELYKNPQWLNLVHYKKNIFSGHTSQADWQKFFLSDDGRNSPENELKATILSMLKEHSTGDLNDHAQCMFPARKLFLEKFLGDKIFKKVKCAKFEEFKKRVSPKGVSLVFSSYHLDSAASTYGHTLLRFIKTDDGEQEDELLDYATNYSANVTTSNALLYAIMGMAGGFRGEFATMPYFYKIREYNDYESRDIWDYRLNLNPFELKMLVAHIWEMGAAFFNYYYLTENCAYHVLGPLDVVNPSWKLQERTPYFVIPVDTLRVVANTPGLLKKVTFRPSIRKKYLERVKSLTDNEYDSFKKIILQKNPSLLSSSPSTKNMSKRQKAKILDTAIDYIDLVYAKDVLLEKTEASKLKRDFLLKRSETSIRAKEIIIVPKKDEIPHLSHPSRKFSFGGGYNKRAKRFYSINYRFALNNFLDPYMGHHRFASLEMANLKFRYYDKVPYRDSSLFEIDEITIMKVISLNPVEAMLSNISWKAHMGYRSQKDYFCNNCKTPFLDAGGGYAIETGKIISYLFGHAKMEVAKKLGRKGYRLGLGPMLGIIYRPYKWVSFYFDSNYHYNFFIKKKNTYKISLSSMFHLVNMFSLDFNVLKHVDNQEGALSVHYYF